MTRAKELSDQKSHSRAPTAWRLYRLALGLGIVWGVLCVEAGFWSIATRALGFIAGAAFVLVGALLTLGIRDSTNQTAQWLKANGTRYLSTRPASYWRFNGVLFLFLGVVAFRVALFP
jgi:hypothetical protein